MGLLIIAVARLPSDQTATLVPLVKALLEKATKKHVLEKMEVRQCVALLAAFPYLSPKRSTSLEEPRQDGAPPQALRLFRTVVERLAEGMQSMDVPLSTSDLARIARAHGRHFQGLDGIASAMSLHLAQLAGISSGEAVGAQMQAAEAREGGTGAAEAAASACGEGARGARGAGGDGGGGSGACVAAPASSWLVFAKLMDCVDLLLGFSLVGSYEVPHSQGGANLTRALVEAALQTCHFNAHVLEGVAASHAIVELLWSLSVAASSDNLRAGAGEAEAGMAGARRRHGVREYLDALQARLLLLLARRWYDREISFAASPLADDAHSANAGARAGRARADALSDEGWRGSEAEGGSEVPREKLLDVHAEMVMQVVLAAPGGMLQDNVVKEFVKHVKQRGRLRDLARIERNTSMLDDMHQVCVCVLDTHTHTHTHTQSGACLLAMPRYHRAHAATDPTAARAHRQVLKFINARVRRGVELGDGGCVVCFMLEAEDLSASPDQTPDIDMSPAVSHTASTEVDTQCGGGSSRGMSRGLSSVKDLQSLRASAMRTSAGSVGAFDSSDVIEVYDARKDCMQRPSHLGVPYTPAGVWLQRVRLLRQRGFTVLQVGTEQWAGLVRAEGGAGSDDGGDLALATRSSRAEWLMKLINTAEWARSLLVFRRGIALPKAAAPLPHASASGAPPVQTLACLAAGEMLELDCKPHASAVSQVSSGAWGALPGSPRDLAGNPIGANVGGDAEGDAHAPQKDAVALGGERIEGGGAALDDMELGQSASSWWFGHGGAASAAAQQVGGKELKIWSLYWSKNKQQWFYHNNVTNDKAIHSQKSSLPFILKSPLCHAFSKVLSTVP